MASTINTTNIDENYPVAGQDNDSQGFRDNFLAIKTGLGVAKNEITDLQSSTASLDGNSDFNDNEITKATLRDTARSTNSGRINISSTVSYQDAHYHRFQMGANTEVTLIEFSPNNTLSEMTLDILDLGTSTDPDPSVGYTVTFKSGANSFIFEDGNDLSSTSFVLERSKIHVFDFWTPDNGDTIYARLRGKYTA